MPDKGLGIKGGFDGKTTTLEYVGVDHSGADVFVAEEFLNGAYVVSVLEEVGGEAVSEGVTRDALLDACLAGSFFDGTLKSGWFEMVTTHDARRTRVR